MRRAEILSHQVEILYDFEGAENGTACAGTIISSYLVLTIATCLAGRNESLFKIRANGKNQNEGQIRTIYAVFSYAAVDSDDSPFDVAVIHLNLELELDKVHTFEIRNDRSQGPADENFSGTTSACREPGFSEVRTVALSECSEILKGENEKNFICTKPVENVTGSSQPLLIGSGLICSGVLYGVLAVNSSNSEKRLYTSVSQYSHWIRFLLDDDEGDAEPQALFPDYGIAATSYNGKVVNQITDPVPYQLSVQYNGEHQCGGVILDQKTVLSAAHCFNFPKIDLYKIVAGEQNLDKDDKTEQVFSIEKIVKHPNYQQFPKNPKNPRDRNYKDVMNGFDIAVIWINGEFNFSEQVNNIWISSPTTETSNYQLLNLTGTATGWGKTETGDQVPPSPVLLSVELELLEHSRCKKRWGFLSDSMLCGYSNVSNICGGDSGGPLVLKNYKGEPQTHTDLLIGISSFGPGKCEAQDYPNGFTKVSSYYNWIAENRPNSLCLPCQFQCFNGECIDKALKCNKKFDCADGSDEKVCSSRILVPDLDLAWCGTMEVDQIKNPVLYQLSIRHNENHVCGGIILDKKTALSAAQCFPSKVLSRYRVVAGEKNLNKNDSTEQVLQIQRVSKHPDFKSPFTGNDIAVIQVKGEFNFTERVNNVWISSQTSPNFQDVTGRATGWGKMTRNGTTSNVLHSIDLVLLEHKVCKNRWSFLQHFMFCGYNNFSNLCGGGAGGPLVIKNHEHAQDTRKDLLVGLSSFGPRNCKGKNEASGFTNVSHFYDWIAEKRSNSLCSSSQFQCFNGECIDEELKCDKKYDCEDGSDEKVCSSHSRVTRDCGGLIKVAYSNEIQWQAPTSHPHPHSSCLWVIANPHADRPTKTQIKISNSLRHQFDTATSQLYVVQNLTGNQLSTFPLNETDFEYNFIQPFLMLYFRTNSTDENRGIHLKISDKSDSSDYMARNVQGLSLPVDLIQNTSQSQKQSLSHVYSGSHCKSKVKNRHIFQNAPQIFNSNSQNPPYVVSVELDGEHVCSGVILDKKTVISTSSCFDLIWRKSENKTIGIKSNLKQIRTQIRIVAGEQNLNREPSIEQIVEIERLLKHEKYKFSNVSRENDIALIHVKGEFTFNAHVNNIWIASPDFLNLEGASGRVFAWNFTNRQDVKFLPDLKTMNMNTLKNSECKKIYPFLKESMICGSRNSTNVCGMTGAPFVLKHQRFGFGSGNFSRDVLIGLSAFGDVGCESIKRPVAFTRVDYFYDWIEKNRANSICSASEFQCYNGGCIDKELKCNYVFDCSDGSDESVCKSGSGSSITIKLLDSCFRRLGNQNSIADQSNALDHENLFVFLKPVEDGGRIQVHLDALQMVTVQDYLSIISYRQNTQEITQLDNFQGAGNWSNEIVYGDENEPVLIYFHARPGNKNQKVDLNYFERPKSPTSNICGGNLIPENEMEIVYQIPTESQSSTATPETTCEWNIQNSNASLIEVTLFHNPLADFDAASGSLSILGNSALSTSTKLDEKYKMYKMDASSIKLTFRSNTSDPKTGFHLFLKNQQL